MDISNLFDSAVDKVKTQVSQVVATGAPAVLAGIEQYGAQQLAQLSADTKQVATNAANQIASQPGSNNPIVQSIESVFSDVGQSAIFKQYGAIIVLTIGGIFILGRILK